MPLYYVNVPQYDDVLNNKTYLQFEVLEVTEFRNDFQSVSYKSNQTDLKIINNHFQIGVSFMWNWINFEFIWL